MTVYGILRGLGGGALIGLAAAILLLVHGRIAGVSGILGRVIDRDDSGGSRIGFIAGLVVTGAVIAAIEPAAFGAAVRGLPMLAFAGGLVGFGCTLANGCTSGHGVCGIARLSPRSMVAVVTFMLAAAITVAILGAHA
jgi:hypothetical protein